MAMQLTDEILVEELKIILESWPLYREFRYDGAEGVDRLPRHLQLRCDLCGLETSWEASFSSTESNKSGFDHKSYVCRNCDARTHRFYFFWRQGRFLKIGQYPAQEDFIGATLKGILNPDDLRMYQHALRMRNFNMGIAAVAYLRRVVENRINDMIDILHEAAIIHKANKETLDRLQEVKAEKRFSEKVDYAGRLLPSNLRPAGKPNPMVILHQLASAGIHEGSDEECVEIFDACRSTFEYVFSRIRIELDDARAYVEGMDILLKKREDKQKAVREPTREADR